MTRKESFWFTRCFAALLAAPFYLYVTEEYPLVSKFIEIVVIGYLLWFFLSRTYREWLN